ncbi:hypothetical protein [Synechococcus sp. MIT S1220]|uniref:hypothetical protein n=1 Tax=Synechococcus sp. MIT S1220 TaxID=3082549 RepID=UPI0039B09D54
MKDMTKDKNQILAHASLVAWGDGIQKKNPRAPKALGVSLSHQLVGLVQLLEIVSESTG